MIRPKHIEIMGQAIHQVGLAMACLGFMNAAMPIRAEITHPIHRSTAEWKDPSTSGERVLGLDLDGEAAVQPAIDDPALPADATSWKAAPIP